MESLGEQINVGGTDAVLSCKGGNGHTLSTFGLQHLSKLGKLSTRTPDTRRFSIRTPNRIFTACTSFTICNEPFSQLDNAIKF
jgi:hypothetical protein